MLPSYLVQPGLIQEEDEKSGHPPEVRAADTVGLSEWRFSMESDLAGCCRKGKLTGIPPACAHLLFVAGRYLGRTDAQ